jgi:acetyl/propionyl-CoA carboxylase alpha subunit
VLREPQGPWVRVDSGLAAGSEVTVFYDPMLAKLSVWGADRDAARTRLIEALGNYVILGVTTNIPFLADVLRHEAFARGATHTGFLAEHLPNWAPAAARVEDAVVAAALHQLLAPTSGGGAGGPAPAPSPYRTLGAWRLGPGAR